MAHQTDNRQKIHNAKLEGPAPAPKEQSNDTLIFTSTYTNNFSHKNTVDQINSLFHLPRTERMKDVFGNCKVIQAYRQPRNLLRHLTRASFAQSNTQEDTVTKKNGLFRCRNKNCKLCRLYIQECTSFMTHNDTEWQIRSHINCNSVNALYLLKCMKCKNQIKPTSKTGQTVNLRDRMNNHISDCKLGGSSDLFDQHVYECKKQSDTPDAEPYFHIFLYMTVKKVNTF